LNFQHPAKKRTAASAMCVASRRPRPAWRHAHDLARAQSACPAGILSTRPADALGVKQEIEKALAQDRTPTK
jgi:hypothetical protein